MSRFASVRRRFASIIVLACAVTATAALTTAGTGPRKAEASVRETSAAAVYWAIRNDLSGDCLTGYASSGVVVTEPCNADRIAQEWHWINSARDPRFRLLKNRWTGTCLMIGSPVVLRACNDTGGRQWKKISWGDGTYYLYSAADRDRRLLGYSQSKTVSAVASKSYGSGYRWTMHERDRG